MPVSTVWCSQSRRVRRASWVPMRPWPAAIMPHGVPALLNTVLALLAVLAVMAAHAVYKLLRLPFRLLHGLFRHNAKPVPLTAR